MATFIDRACKLQGERWYQAEFLGKLVTSVHAIYSGKATDAVSGQSSCNDSVISPWFHHPCFLFTAVLVKLFVCTRFPALSCCLRQIFFSHLPNSICLKSPYSVYDFSFITAVCLGLCLLFSYHDGSVNVIWSTDRPRLHQIHQM